MTSYREAGVDLEAAEALVAEIGSTVTATWHDGVVGGFGGFAAGITLPAGFVDPVLMMSTDGVGTKAELARRTGLVAGLGWDLVAMCVDDLAAAGARPLAMTDYLAVGSLDVASVAALVSSIAAACVEAGVALLGGETAEHPGVMAPDAFDLSGAALGVVERGREITGDAIAPGDAVVGLDSPNLRANGFSLIRKALADRVDLDAELPGTGRRAADVLLEPSVLYAPAIGALRSAVPVHGLAHITGGGLPGNVARVLPVGCRAVIDAAAWQPAPVFPAVRRLVGGAEDELFRTFNMGIGFVAVVPPDAADDAIAVLEAEERPAKVIGTVTAGHRAVELHHPAR